MEKAHPLSNFEIDNMLKDNKNYIGTFSRDNTQYLKKNQSLILNLDDKKGNGTHWTAIIKNENGTEIYYFDSFGLPPPQEIVNMYKKKKNKIKYSSNEIQLPSSIMCGYYCVMFIKEYYKGNDIYDIIYSFDLKPTQRNEQLIKKYFNVV